jgi:hypothetical protein
VPVFWSCELENSDQKPAIDMLIGLQVTHVYSC